MNCRDCGVPMVPKTQPRPAGFAEHGARGLCHRDYVRRLFGGALDDFPVSVKLWRDIADDYNMLRREGYPLDVIAARLRMSTEALDRALCRHRDDHRARRPA